MTNNCDGCPGLAQVSVITPTGVLILCQHHGNEAIRQGYPVSPVYSTPLYLPQGWEACGFGLPVNGPDCHHSEYDRWEN